MRKHEFINIVLYFFLMIGWEFNIIGEKTES